MRPAASVGAGRGLVAGHVTTVPLGTMVTRHVYHAAVTWQELMKSSATRR